MCDQRSRIRLRTLRMAFTRQFGPLLEQHKWDPRDKEKNQLSVIQCYCPTCRRTVYAEDTESPECPVCLTPVFVSSEKTPERPNAGKKNGSSTKN